MSPPLVSTLPEDGGITCAKWGAISHDSQRLGDGQVVFLFVFVSWTVETRGLLLQPCAMLLTNNAVLLRGIGSQNIICVILEGDDKLCMLLFTYKTWWWVFSIEPSAVDTNSSALSERAKQSAVMLLSIFTEVRYCVCVQHMELAPVSPRVNTTELKSHDRSCVKCHMWNRMLLKVPLGRD